MLLSVQERALAAGMLGQLGQLASWLGRPRDGNPLNEKAERLASSCADSMPLRSVQQHLQDISDTFEALVSQQSAEELQATLDGASTKLPTALGRAWQRLERVASDLGTSSSVRPDDIAQLAQACRTSLQLFAAVVAGATAKGTHGSPTLIAALAQPCCIVQLASLVVQLQALLQRLQHLQPQQRRHQQQARNIGPGQQHLRRSQMLLQGFMHEVRAQTQRVGHLQPGRALPSLPSMPHAFFSNTGGL